MYVMHISIYTAAGSPSCIPYFTKGLTVMQKVLSVSILSAFLVTAYQTEETYLSPFLSWSLLAKLKKSI
jgi:hypothetical protein